MSMSNIRRKIERWFETFGDLIYRRRWLAFILILVLVAGLASQVPKITFDLSTEGFLHKDDPARTTYTEFRKDFGRDDLIIIAIQPPKVFDMAFLGKLKSLHEELEKEVPYLEDVLSLVNARNTRGEEDSLIVEDLLENWPRDEADLEALRKRVMSNALYQDRLISQDGRFTTVVIKTNSFSSLAKEQDVLAGFEEEESGNGEAESEELQFLTDEENKAVVDAVRRVIAGYENPDFRIYMAGMPVTVDVIKRTMLHDVSRFVRLVLLTIGICLFLLFRRVTGVLLPLLVVVFSALSTLGLMSIFQVSFKLPTAILPSFILAVGVGAAVHLLSIFYQDFQKTGDKKGAICHALGHSGLAIVMTSLTTAAGLASFSASQVAPIADLGVFASVGVLAALVYSIVLLPALLAIIPLKVKKSGSDNSRRLFMDRILSVTARFSTGHPKSITCISLGLIVLSILGASRLTFSHNVIGWLPEGVPIRVSTEKIDRELKGTIALEVIVDTEQENGLYDVETLNLLDGLAAEMVEIQGDDFFVGKATSISDILKEIHQALNENQSEFYTIPQDPKVIPQEFLLFENSGSDDLEEVVDSQFSRTRFTIQAPWLDFLKYQPFIPEIEDRFLRAFGERAKITLTGMMAIGSRTIYAAIHSMKESYIIAGCVITIMMILLVGSLKIGLVSMFPNLLPIVITLGVMGWFGFPLDMFSMMIGSIAIGLAVDDTIHFMHNFRRYYSDSGDVGDAVQKTLHTAGRAMLVTSVVLSLGFFIYLFASMNNLFYFGLLTGLTIILALLADFFLAPALMALIHRPVRK
jgi:predicted RND superfamily exporter protein